MFHRDNILYGNTNPVLFEKEFHALLVRFQDQSQLQQQRSSSSSTIPSKEFRVESDSSDPRSSHMPEGNATAGEKQPQPQQYESDPNGETPAVVESSSGIPTDRIIDDGIAASASLPVGEQDASLLGTPDPMLEELIAASKKAAQAKSAKQPQHKFQKKKAPASPQQANKGKQGRTWDNEYRYSDSAARELDAARNRPVDNATNDNNDSSNNNSNVTSVAAASSGDITQKYGAVNLDDFSNEDSNEELVYDETKPESSAPAPKGRLASLFSSITGNKVLDRTDIDKVLVKFKEGLMAKNVASEIAQKLGDSVAANLVGKKLGTFSSVSSVVKSGLGEALERILTPRRHIDILHEVMQAREQGRPYSIVFVGVNGVGKSTNLAKVCFWLLQNKLSVMIAACDTFRSGAVEQLAVHARNLNVPLFHRGYGKDAATIAHEAVSHAKSQNIDVVLIDTAGRMQDNEPLMRALAKLINVNKPDLVLFVGEALVGNDGVDQLVKFNQCLSDLSPDSNPRLIDGIVLTKFDTIDDKVGAAISMVYTTGQPIVFVGVGQSYPDLKSLNINTVVSALMS